MGVHASRESYEHAVADVHVDDRDDLHAGPQGQSLMQRSARFGGPDYEVSSFGLYVIDTDARSNYTGGYNKWLSTMDTSDLVFRAQTPLLGIGGYFFATLSEGQIATSAIVTVTVRSHEGTAQVDLSSQSDRSFLGFTGVDAPIVELRIHIDQPAGAPLEDRLYSTVEDFQMSAMTSAVPEVGTGVLMSLGALLLGSGAGRCKRQPLRRRARHPHLCK
jgi:hypothetical protein